MKRIAKLEVIKPGSNPDIDSDYNTEVREIVLEEAARSHGEDKIANITTFTTLAAKGAFKAMCTIYEVPFAQSNKIASLIPKPIEGVECTVDDIFNPDSDRYNEGEEFRSATAGSEWEKIIAGARAIEGRNKAIGMHPCFTEGALIKTDKGYKSIEDVSIGDFVLTHTNTYKKVMETMVNKSSDIYRLKTDNSIPTEVTGNHPFYVRSVIRNHPIGVEGLKLTQPHWKPLNELDIKDDLIGVAIEEDSVFTIDPKSAAIQPVSKNEKYMNFIKEVIDCTFSVDEGEYTYLAESKEDALRVVSLVNKSYRVACSIDEIEEDGLLYKVSFNLEGNSESKFFYDDGYLWVSISEISKVEKEAETYNLSVLDDNSYTVNNLIAHNCGIILSSKDLSSVIPLQTRQKDGRISTQWTYTDCEDLGLIKMDYLGLDTVDLIQYTVENIMRNGKTPPNMTKIIHGDMDDAKTYAMLRRGETIGVFQLASPGVMDLLRRMEAEEFEDIVAITALYRPGPMGMQSHVKYADRKTGREEIEALHPDFIDSPLEKILEKTQGLVTYQEQIIQIASQVAGMTLQEGDDLRKAMGKKKIAVMDKMKPLFFEGAMKNGYSEEAVTILWDTVALFAKYGFNRSHSVAYAMNAYQAAYLKANYPVEFMAALISQNIGDKDKILTFLKEARRMGLTVGTVDINVSDVRVAPDFTKKSGFDIVYGLGGVDAVSNDVAKIIVGERDKKGNFKSVQDLINRCQPLGVSNKRVYENLALAGAFDAFGISRRAVVDNLPGMISEAKTKSSKGASLFDMFSGTADVSVQSIDLSSVEEYPYVEKLKREANVIGLYLTGHPLDRIGKGVSQIRDTTIEKLFAKNEVATVTIAGSITEIERKIMRRGKSVSVTIDDGTGYITAFLNRDIVKGIDKLSAQEKLRKLYLAGENMVTPDVKNLAANQDFTAIPDINKNEVYVMNITFRPERGDSPSGARVNSIRPLRLASNGMLPVRIRFKATPQNEDKMKQLYKILPANLDKKIPGDYPIHVSIFRDIEKHLKTENESVYLDAISEMESDDKRGVNLVEKASSVTKKSSAGSETLIGGKATVKNKGKAKAVKSADLRSWPPKAVNEPLPEKIELNRNDRLINAIETLPYKETNFTCDKSPQTRRAIEKFLGIENFDFGSFDRTILDDLN